MTHAAESDAPEVVRDACLNCGEPIETGGPNGWVHTGSVGKYSDGVACDLVFVAEPSGCVIPPGKGE